MSRVTAGTLMIGDSVDHISHPGAGMRTRETGNDEFVTRYSCTTISLGMLRSLLAFAILQSCYSHALHPTASSFEQSSRLRHVLPVTVLLLSQPRQPHLPWNSANDRHSTSKYGQAGEFRPSKWRPCTLPVTFPTPSPLKTLSYP